MTVKESRQIEKAQAEVNDYSLNTIAALGYSPHANNRKISEEGELIVYSSSYDEGNYHYITTKRYFRRDDLLKLGGE